MRRLVTVLKIFFRNSFIKVATVRMELHRSSLKLVRAHFLVLAEEGRE